jgi:hypothetical protein
VRRPNEWVSYVWVRYEIYAPSYPLTHLPVVQQLMAQPAHTTTGTGKRSGYQQAGLHSFPGPGTRSAPIPSRTSLPLPLSGPKVAQVVPPSASAQLTIQILLTHFWFHLSSLFQLSPPFTNILHPRSLRLSLPLMALSQPLLSRLWFYLTNLVQFGLQF